jgi:hypothetical protein
MVSSPPSGRFGGLFREPLFLILALLGAIISLHIQRGEFHFYGDEMRHAVTGMFFRDVLVDMPWRDPLRYVKEYYAKYPALGLPHWPPLFYLIEGIYFLVFGFSPWASRLCVLSFALLGVYCWYRIAERQGSRRLAIMSSLIFPLLPYILVFERVTMLEIPMIALSLAAILFWLKFLESDRARDIWLVGLFSTMAFLTSQKAMFLPVFLAVHFMMERPWRVLRRVHLWAALLASGLAVVPWYLMSFDTLSLSYERVTGQSFHHLSRWQTELPFYPQRLLAQVGIVWVILGGAGIVWALFRQPRKYGFFLAWVASCYAVFTALQEKDTRHTMIWVPAVIYLGLVMVEQLFAGRRWVYLGFGALFLHTLIVALNTDRPRLWGVEAAARYVTSLPESDLIYYQGSLNGDFIFFVRKYDPQKEKMVAREKQVVATKILSGYGTREILTTPEEILNFFQSWGIRYAVVEDRDFLPELAVVRKVLDSDAFENVQTFTVESNNPNVQNLRIVVYRYRGPLKRTIHHVTVPMMTIRRDITANLDRIVGRPWPNN